MSKPYSTVINKPVYIAEEGLYLGNGDFSVSCYQKPGKIVFQLGKNDFWDRRLDLSQNPKPANIEELKSLIDRGVKVDGVTFEVKGKNISARDLEVLQVFPSSRRSAPMPKMAGELYIHVPGDWNDCTWKQQVVLAKGELIIECYHYDGAKLTVKAVVHPEKNLLAVAWQLENCNKDNLYGGSFHGLPDVPPVYATCFRKTEISSQEFADSEMLEHGNTYFCYANPFPTLPAAKVENGVLTQINPDGGKLFITLAGDENSSDSSTDKFLRQLPPFEARSGEFYVGISTGSKEDALIDAGKVSYADIAECAEKSAAEFWSKSEVDFGEKLLNDCFYSALHAKRCVLKKGKLPPGLFMPSTLQYYTQWKGDYHFNYNYQSIFLGDYETNHFETGDAYFEGVKNVIKLGEKISRDYYNIDGGCFIQLFGYPLESEDDYYGYLPLGRMAYMTGWLAAYFYRRYRFSCDKEFLADVGYPFLKKVAIFYENFFVKGEDGFYHAYPSNSGEKEFSRSGATDQMQVLTHGAFALHAAAEAAEIIGVDAEPAQKWREISQKIPQVEFMFKAGNDPEFTAFDGEVPQKGERPDFLTVGNRYHDFYFGQMPYKFSIYLRNDLWKKEEWYNELLVFLKRWELPNCLLRAYSAATHYFHGGHTESLGIVGALTDMLMISSKGTVKLFKGIPEKQRASFKNLRAEGAFLISATKECDEVKAVSVFAEAGGKIKIENPWFPGKCQINYSDGRKESFADHICVLTMDKNLCAELVKE